MGNETDSRENAVGEELSRAGGIKKLLVKSRFNLSTQELYDLFHF